MEVSRSKLTGLAIALAYAAIAIATSGWDTKGVIVMSTILSLPVVFIWFPDDIEAFTDIGVRARPGRYDKKVPAFMVSLSGWLILVVVLPLIAYMLH
jgi:hypothetical protein